MDLLPANRRAVATAHAARQIVRLAQHSLAHERRQFYEVCRTPYVFFNGRLPAPRLRA
jgi:hypothetical protein